MRNLFRKRTIYPFGKDQSYLEYGPISVETYEAAWVTKKRDVWVSLLKNKTYFALSSSTYQDVLTMLSLDLIYEKPGLEDLLFSILMRPDLSASDANALAQEFGNYTAVNPNTRHETLVAVIIRDPHSYWGHKAIYHENLSIDFAARLILDDWERVISGGIGYSQTLHAGVNKKCDKYLGTLGWDEETLAVTPLRMKLEAIR